VRYLNSRKLRRLTLMPGVRPGTGVISQASELRSAPSPEGAVLIALFSDESARMKRIQREVML
jgi:hypothetical protein